MDFRSLANKIVDWVLTISSDPGQLAELRRTGFRSIFSVPFLKLMVSVVEPLYPPPKSPEGRERYYRDFATIARSAAVLAVLHNPKASLGTALASTGYSEQRLLRLLRAKGDILEHEIAACSLWLSREGPDVVRIDFKDIVALVIAQEGKLAEQIRLDIAQQYFKEIERASLGKKPQDEASVKTYSGA
jgi:hypothetical protein